MGYIKTIKDLEAATYGLRGGHSNQLLKAAGIATLSGANGLGGEWSWNQMPNLH